MEMQRQIFVFVLFTLQLQSSYGNTEDGTLHCILTHLI